MSFNNIMTILLGVTLFGACIDDKGNYDYLSENDVMPAEISNLEDSIVSYSEAHDVLKQK